MWWVDDSDHGDEQPMMVGYEHVLVEEALAEHLEILDLPRADTIRAIIYEPCQRLEIRTYRQLIIRQLFSPDTIRDLDLEGERLLLGVQPELRRPRHLSHLNPDRCTTAGSENCLRSTRAVITSVTGTSTMNSPEPSPT